MSNINNIINKIGKNPVIRDTGLFSSYQPDTTHKDIVYYATDRRKIYLNNKEYGSGTVDEELLETLATKDDLKTLATKEDAKVIYIDYDISKLFPDKSDEAKKQGPGPIQHELVDVIETLQLSVYSKRIKFSVPSGTFLSNKYYDFINPTRNIINNSSDINITGIVIDEIYGPLKLTFNERSLSVSAICTPIEFIDDFVTTELLETNVYTKSEVDELVSNVDTSDLVTKEELSSVIESTNNEKLTLSGSNIKYTDNNEKEYNIVVKDNNNNILLSNTTKTIKNGSISAYNGTGWYRIFDVGSNVSQGSISESIMNFELLIHSNFQQYGLSPIVFSISIVGNNVSITLLSGISSDMSSGNSSFKKLRVVTGNQGMWGQHTYIDLYLINPGGVGALTNTCYTFIGAPASNANSYLVEEVPSNYTITEFIPVDGFKANKFPLLDTKADVSNVYTKSETDLLLSNITIDTSNLATKEELENKVDKEENKGLSTNDFTNDNAHKLNEVIPGILAECLRIIELEKQESRIFITWKNGYNGIPIIIVSVKSNITDEELDEMYPDDPVRPGYIFNGWGMQEKDENGNITITAKWKVQ